ncbi:hypothetical protein [Corynebacterium caspium]|nr:hypothetical protein [Corynebacterium caspium]
MKSLKTILLSSVGSSTVNKLKKCHDKKITDTYEDLLKSLHSVAHSAAHELSDDLGNLKEQGKEVFDEARSQAAPLAKEARKRLEKARAEMEHRTADFADIAAQAQREAATKGKKLSKRTAKKLEKVSEKAAIKAQRVIDRRLGKPSKGDKIRQFLVVSSVLATLGALVAWVLRSCDFDHCGKKELVEAPPLLADYIGKSEPESELRYSTVTPVDAETEAEADAGAADPAETEAEAEAAESSTAEKEEK